MKKNEKSIAKLFCLFTFAGIGTAVGPVITGYAAEMGSYYYVFVFGGLLFLLSSLFNFLALILKRRKD